MDTKWRLGVRQGSGCGGSAQAVGLLREHIRTGKEVKKMAMPKDSFQSSIQDQLVDNWKTFINNMEKSLDTLEKGIDEATEMSSVCTAEWCEATEHVIDELSNSIFSISEPHWSSEEDNKKIKQLRKRVHDLYAMYKSAAS
ncbi:MAG: hypothetical protein R6V46_14565 [Desulfatiglandaceae bacterium]